MVAISADNGAGLPRTLRKNQPPPRPPAASARTRLGTFDFDALQFQRRVFLCSAGTSPALHATFIARTLVDGLPIGQTTPNVALATMKAASCCGVEQIPGPFTRSQPTQDSSVRGGASLD